MTAGRVLVAVLAATLIGGSAAAMPSAGPGRSEAALPPAALSKVALSDVALTKVALSKVALSKVDCLPAPPALDPTVPWAQQRLTPARAWALSTGAGILVAVVDSGVDGRAPQLAGRVERGLDMLANGEPGDTDCVGHGTFVAGIIAAAPMVGTGFVGVAPHARILPIRATAGQEGVAAAFGRGIRTAVDAGAKVINVSASTTVADPVLLDSIQYAESHDVVVVASTAKDSTGAVPVYPAALPTVLAVGAVDVSGAPADFSRPGSYLGLAAPGVDVTSIGPGGPGQWVGSGTSYAAAFVTGAAALVRAYRPGLTAAQVRHRLQVTADHPATLPDPLLGWGVVNPMAALATVLPEEGSGDAAVRAVPEPIPPTFAAADRQGKVFVLVGAGAMVLVAGLAALFAVLGPRGHRRRWRPARVARPVQD